MKIKTGITLVALVAAVTMTTAFAHGPGADIYKTKCQVCHGASDLADSGPGKGDEGEADLGPCGKEND